MTNIPTYNAQAIIDQEHERIHSEKGFTITRKHATLGAGASSDIAITTGVHVYPHVRKFIANATGGPLDGFVYENSVISGGTGLTIQNNVRGSSVSSGATAVHSPTVSDIGDEFDYALMPVPTAIGANVGGVTGADIGEEWVLEPNKTYIFRVTNNSAAAIDVGWHIFFYLED